VKQTVGSIRKGACELRNLVSTINYDDALTVVNFLVPLLLIGYKELFPGMFGDLIIPRREKG
jgi:hypothetical protein